LYRSEYGRGLFRSFITSAFEAEAETLAEAEAEGGIGSDGSKKPKQQQDWQAEARRERRGTVGEPSVNGGVCQTFNRYPPLEWK